MISTVKKSFAIFLTPLGLPLDVKPWVLAPLPIPFE
jgi:hypothetical protein